MKRQSQKLVLAGWLRWAVVFVTMVLFSSGAAMAKDKAVCLDAKAVANLKSIYVKRRDVNMAGVLNMLKVNNTVIQGTQDFAYRYAVEFKKNLTKNDPLLASLNSSDSIRSTESSIKKFGRDAFIEGRKKSISKLQVKYDIYRLVLLTSSKIGISEDEIASLLAFAATRARSEAVISVVSRCQE
jgi:hypothetical protein